MNTHRCTGTDKRDDGNIVEWITECRKTRYTVATEELRMANWQYPLEARITLEAVGAYVAWRRALHIACDDNNMGEGKEEQRKQRRGRAKADISDAIYEYLKTSVSIVAFSLGSYSS